MTVIFQIKHELRFLNANYYLLQLNENGQGDRILHPLHHLGFIPIIQAQQMYLIMPNSNTSTNSQHNYKGIFNKDFIIISLLDPHDVNCAMKITLPQVIS